jgi:hypothetical protein
LIKYCLSSEKAARENSPEPMRSRRRVESVVKRGRERGLELLKSR